MNKLLSKTKYKVIALSLILGMTTPNVNANDLGSLFGQSSQSKFLPVHQAFKVSALQDGNKVVVNFVVTPEHYVYRDKIRLTLPEGVTASDWKFSSSPTTEDDPLFGQVWVFDQNVTATATLSSKNAVTDDIKIRWQGCARAGLCYPPENITVKIDLAGDGGQAENTQVKTTEETTSNTQKTSQSSGATNQKSSQNTTTSNAALMTQNRDGQSVSPTNAKNTENVATHDKNAPTLPDNTDTNAKNQDNDAQNVTNNVTLQGIDSNPQYNFNLVHSLGATGEIDDPFGLSKNPVLAMGLLFLAGLVLAFSACVYPMIPIVTNIVAHQHKPSAFKGFLLTLAYALGVATSYGLLGVLVAWFGRSLGIIGWMQNAWVLLAFGLVFTVLALYMLEVVKIRLPSSIMNRLQNLSTSADTRLGSVGGSFLVGLLSAFVVSPCVSAPLGGSLVAVAMIGNVFLGFWALFALGLGLSFPLIVMGTMQSKLMPKSGDWMHGIRHFGGFLLLGVATLLINRVFTDAWMLVVWALWFCVFGVWLWRWRVLLLQGIGVLMMGWSVCLLVGASIGNYDVWQPLQNFGQSNKSEVHNDIKVTRLEELDQVLMRHPKVLVDVTAEWCVECRIMEKTLFTHRPAELNEFVVVKLDITETNDDSRAILARYDLFGPPALLYYRSGQIVKKQIGEIKRDEFVAVLNSIH